MTPTDAAALAWLGSSQRRLLAALLRAMSRSRHRRRPRRACRSARSASRSSHGRADARRRHPQRTRPARPARSHAKRQGNSTPRTGSERRAFRCRMHDTRRCSRRFPIRRQSCGSRGRNTRSAHQRSPSSGRARRRHTRWAWRGSCRAIWRPLAPSSCRVSRAASTRRRMPARSMPKGEPSACSAAASIASIPRSTAISLATWSRLARSSASFPSASRRCRITSRCATGSSRVSRRPSWSSKRPRRAARSSRRRAALEQGRDVMVVPGPTTGGRNRGGHLLIRDGARIVESADDILRDLSFGGRPDRPIQSSSVRRAIARNIGFHRR